MSDTEGTRINKFLSEIGYCSRREADVLLKNKRITINGKVATLGAKVHYDDEVKLDGDTLSTPKKEKPIYIALNKPAGIVCTTDNKKEKNNIVDFIGHDSRIFPIGRLDKDSEGLIFLTNNGDIVNKILRAGNQHEKEYIVTVNRAITPAFIKGMASGVPILGVKTKKCEVESLGKHQFRIVLTQGLNRQIRRMCVHFGYEVKALTRVRIMNIKLDMPVGKWRNFHEYEVEELLAMVAISDNDGAKARQKKRKPSAHRGDKSAAVSATARNTSSSRRNSKETSIDAYQNPKSRNLRKGKPGRKRK